MIVICDKRQECSYPCYHENSHERGDTCKFDCCFNHVEDRLIAIKRKCAPVYVFIKKDEFKI